jgi:UDP-N-acetyl-2-amino-2-deoxyglucuronate dehydrogenase
VATAAVVGCGDVSVVHLAALRATTDAELVGVCDTDPARAGEAGDRHGVPSFTDHRELLERLRPDVVHVCTPHDQHAPVVVDCLDAGAHVLVEKPLAHTVAAAATIVRAAAEHPELKVGVCFQNRYNPTSRAMRSVLASGALGQVLGGSAAVLWHRTPEYYAARPWRGDVVRSGGGVLINQAIHTLDLVQWLVGDVTGVRGDVGRYGPESSDVDVEDTASLVLAHGPDVRTLFYASTLNVVDAPVRVEVVAAGGVLRLDGGLTVVHGDGRTETVRDEATGADGGRSYWGTSHRLLIEDFYRRLPGPTPFWIGPEEAMKTMRTLEQAYAGRAAPPR